MTKKLLIISSDYISSWIEKGEVVPRYYNPGNFFEEVHIMMTNDDKPDPFLLQSMVGSAKLFIYNCPEPKKFFKKTLGWQPFLMKKWADEAIVIARKIQPSLVRCYGLHLNTFLGAKIKQILEVPFITSLHGNPDVDYFRGRLAKNLKDKIIGKCQEKLEKFCLRFLDHVIAVYSPVESYLKKNRVKSYSVIHNVVGLGLSKKQDYSIDPEKINLLCVGRQTYLQKDPVNIIRAISFLKNAHLTLVGDGDLHDALVNLARDLRCDHRVTFIKTMNNKDLIFLMKDIDIYIYHSINYEISKSCIEAALVGLPIILNDRFGQPAQELKDANFYLVEDSPKSYKNAIEKLLADKEFRMKLAKVSHNYALQNWAPEITEKKLVDLYKKYVSI
jgi:glycosyltransferase involved in cell wall biosynthesis